MHLLKEEQLIPSYLLHLHERTELNLIGEFVSVACRLQWYSS